MRFLSFLFGRRKKDAALDAEPSVVAPSTNPGDAAPESPPAPPRAELSPTPAPVIQPSTVSASPAYESLPVSAARPPARVQWDRDFYPVEVVGESNYQDALIAICGRHTRHSQYLEFDAVIELEPTNAHDPSAIVVKIEGHKVGYLPKEQAARVGAQMREEGLSAATCGARVRGGWRTNQYDTGHYGVYLAIPERGWIDFGIGSTPPAKPTPSRPIRKVQRPEAAETGPLLGHWIALMGTRRDSEIAQQLAAAGAKIMAGPGKSTTLLVVVEDKPFSVRTMRSATYRKAEELIAEGAPLRIVSIDDVRAMMVQG